eukprot:Lithocolla_globosa_v1_NODE_69_length_7060_cov_437.109350.p1 type:complete len:2074 gc:universal NODE_69_length_7060_cov_437.109350:459-6680(+)
MSSLKGLNAARLLCKMPSSNTDSFPEVTLDEMTKTLKDEEERLMVAKSGGLRSYTGKNAFSGKAKDLLRTLRSVEKHMPGTQEEALYHRNQLWSLWNKYGPPSFFVTFNPNDVNSVTLMSMLGMTFEQVEEKLTSFPKSSTPCHQAIAQDPVTCARYFDECVKIFIEHGIGWDAKNNRPKEGGGLYGTANAFYGVTEAQARLTLHSHFLIWINEVPDSDITQVIIENKTEETTNVIEINTEKTHERIDQMNDEETEKILTKTDLIGFVKSIITTKYVPDFTCPESGDNLVAVPNFVDDSKLKKPRSPYIPEPKVAMCSACEKNWSATELLKDKVQSVLGEDVWNQYDDNPTLLLNNISHFISCCNLFCLDQIEDVSKMLNHESVSAMLNYCKENELFCFKDDGIDYDITHIDVKAAYSASLALIQYDNVSHDYHHRETCFKYGAGCRFNKPAVSVFDYEFNSERELLLKRPPGSNWLTGHQLELTSSFLCNNDVRALFLTGEGTSESYYCTNYTAKPQEKIENSRLLSAFEKRKEKEEKDKQKLSKLSPFELGVRRIQGLIANIHAKQEMGGPLACLYSLKGTNVYFSHKFSRQLLLPQLQAYLRNEKIDGNLIPVPKSDPTQQQKWQVLPDIFDYLLRSENLFDLNVWDFQSQGEKKTLKNLSKKAQELLKKLEKSDDDSDGETDVEDDNPHGDDGSDDETDIEEDDDAVTGGQDSDEEENPSDKLVGKFVAPHCQADTHAWESFPKHLHRVVFILGGRLPDIEKLETNSHLQFHEESETYKLRELYGMTALGLFKPFSISQPLQPTNGSWWTAYKEWKEWEQPENVTTILKNMQLYYHSKRRARELAATRKKNQLGEHDDDVDDHADADEYADELSHDYEEYLENLQDSFIMNGMEIDTDDEDNDDNMKTTASTINLAADIFGTIYKQQKTDVSESVSFPQIDAVDSKTIQHWDNTIKLENESMFSESNTDDNHTHLAAETSLSASCKLIYNAFDDLKWKEPHQDSPPKIPDVALNRPSISEVSSLFQLNEKQHLAFCIQALAFFWHLTQQLGDDSSDIRNILADLAHLFPSNRDSLLLHVGGPAGAGKSYVTKALKFLTRSWGCDNAVCLTSTSNISARLLGGYTWQKAVGLNSWGRKNKPSKNLVNFWSQISILVIDECSMLSKKDLAQISNQLQKLKGKEDVPFGGVTVILHGDFFQLGPVRQSSLWAPFWKNERSNPLHIQGKQLYDQLDSVIFLNEDVRSKDPVIKKIKAACRNGQLADIADSTVGSRMLTKKNLPRVFTSIATPNNKERMKGNMASLVTHAKALDRQIYRLYGQFETSGRVTSSLSQDELNQCYRLLNEENFDKTPPILDFIIGMPVQLTATQCFNFGIVKGAQGILVGMKFNKEPKFTEQKIKKHGVSYTVKYPDVMPSRLLVKLEKTDPKLPDVVFDDELGPNIVPIKIEQRTSDKNLPHRQVKPRLSNFPLIPRYFVTGHNTQGKTIPLIISQFTNKFENWNHVVLTRCEFLTDMFVLEPLTSEMAKNVQPSLPLKHEWKHLLTKENETLLRLQRVHSQLGDDISVNFKKIMTENAAKYQYLPPLSDDYKKHKDEKKKAMVTTTSLFKRKRTSDDSCLSSSSKKPNKATSDDIDPSPLNNSKKQTTLFEGTNQASCSSFLNKFTTNPHPHYNKLFKGKGKKRLLESSSGLSSSEQCWIDEVEEMCRLDGISSSSSSRFGSLPRPHKKPKHLNSFPNFICYHDGVPRLLQTYTYKDNSCHFDTFLECLWSCRSVIQHLIDDCAKPSPTELISDFINNFEIISNDVSPLILLLLWDRQQTGYGCPRLRDCVREKVTTTVPTLWSANPRCITSRGKSNPHAWVNHCHTIFGWGYTTEKGCDCCEKHQRVELLPRDLIPDIKCRRQDTSSTALEKYAFDLIQSPPKTQCDFKLARDRSGCLTHAESCSNHIRCPVCETCKNCVYVECPHDSKQTFSPVTAWPPILTTHFKDLNSLETTVSFTNTTGENWKYKLVSVSRYASSHFISYNLDNGKWHLYNDIKKDSFSGKVIVEDLGPTLPPYRDLQSEPNLAFYIKI